MGQARDAPAAADDRVLASLGGCAPLDRRRTVAGQVAFFMVAPDQVRDCKVRQPSAFVRYGGRRAQVDPSAPCARAAWAAYRW